LDHANDWQLIAVAMHRAYRSGLIRCRSNAIDWKSSS
jgi:hypothetical protein